MSGERISVEIDSLLEELIPGYLTGIRNNIASIRESLLSGDFDSIKILGHNMKGSGGGYGFNDITEHGGEIERGAREKLTDVISSAVDRLEDYVNRVDVKFVDM